MRHYSLYMLQKLVYVHLCDITCCKTIVQHVPAQRWAEKRNYNE